MAAKASRRGAKQQRLKQKSVEMIWAAYFKRRAEADKRRRAEREKSR